jgi:hypothetical protein
VADCDERTARGQFVIVHLATAVTQEIERNWVPRGSSELVSRNTPVASASASPPDLSCHSLQLHSPTSKSQYAMTRSMGRTLPSTCTA